MIFNWYWKTIWYWKRFWKEQHFADFHLYTWWFNILKVIFKSNSVSINKKNHIHIKYSLLNKTLHSVKSGIFSIQLWRKLTKFYPMTIISSDHENEIQFFRYHIPCPRILKMIQPPCNSKLGLQIILQAGTQMRKDFLHFDMKKKKNL